MDDLKQELEGLALMEVPQDGYDFVVSEQNEAAYELGQRWGEVNFARSLLHKYWPENPGKAVSQ